jgi:hypothetical protein
MRFTGEVHKNDFFAARPEFYMGIDFLPTLTATKSELLGSKIKATQSYKGFQS